MCKWPVNSLLNRPVSGDDVSAIAAADVRRGGNNMRTNIQGSAPPPDWSVRKYNALFNLAG